MVPRRSHHVTASSPCYSPVYWRLRPAHAGMTDMCPSASVTMAYVTLGAAARFSSRKASIASLRRGAASSLSFRKEAMIRTSYETVTALTFQLDQWGRLAG